MNYQKDIKDDAVGFMKDHKDDFIEGLAEEKDISDVNAMETSFHEQITDRSYTLEDAAVILNESNNVETDSGLWEGLPPKDQITSQAAWTYANDVRERIQEFYEDMQIDQKRLMTLLEGWIRKLAEDTEFEEELENIKSDFNVGGFENFNLGQLKDMVQDEIANPSIAAQQVFKQWEITNTEQPLPPEEIGGMAELDLLRGWIHRADRAGTWGGYPVGSSYIDSRCGSGHGMAEIKEFVDFDQEMAQKVPHMRHKYKEAVKERISELEAKLNIPTIDPQEIQQTLREICKILIDSDYKFSRVGKKITDLLDKKGYSVSDQQFKKKQQET